MANKCEKCGSLKGIIYRVPPTVKDGKRIDKIILCRDCGTPPKRTPDLVPTAPILDTLEAEIDGATKVSDLKAVLRKVIKHLKRRP